MFSWNLSPLQPSAFASEYLLLSPRSALEAVPPRFAPRLRHDPHALLLIGAAIRGADGRVSVSRFSAIHFQGQLIRPVSYYTLLSGYRLP